MGWLIFLLLWEWFVGEEGVTIEEMTLSCMYYLPDVRLPSNILPSS